VMTVGMAKFEPLWNNATLLFSMVFMMVFGLVVSVARGDTHTITKPLSFARFILQKSHLFLISLIYQGFFGVFFLFSISALR
jgi:nitrate/nitrite transporter NarK